MSNEMKTEIVASGLTGRQLVDLLNSDRSKFARKSLNYFDGNQEPEMVSLLDDPYKGRLKWREKGLIPRYRNLTKMIVEKSGLLFKDAAPILNVFMKDEQEPDEAQSTAIAEEMSKIEWAEFFTNFDQVLRLLKTAVLLVQYDTEGQCLSLDILHRANCEVLLNPNNKQINTLIYSTYTSDDVSCYRVITADEFIDLKEVKNKDVSVMGREPNPYGCVPAIPFYDTSTPRTGFWVEAPSDLVSVNEMYNLHLTDSEYAISWAKLPTLFTNCRFADESHEEMQFTISGSNKLPRATSAVTPSLLGGPSKAIMVDSVGTESPFIKYESPSVDIKPMDEVVENWVKAFASDWSVRIRAGGEGQASSGFQLVVEEMTNLELRQQRQRMFENGFKRMYRVVKTVFNTVKPGMFGDEGDLFVTFADPNMPVELKEQEEIWTLRIDQGRATELDYFQEVYGMSEEEAEGKFLEIVLFNKKKMLLTGATNPTEQNVEEDPQEPVEPDKEPVSDE